MKQTLIVCGAIVALLLLIGSFTHLIVLFVGIAIGWTACAFTWNLFPHNNN